MTQWIITSSVLILIIAVLRFVLRGKISLKLQYALWGLVLIRLMLPFSVFESPASVLNLMQEREETFEPPVYYEPYVPETITPAVPDEDIFILDDNIEHIKPDVNVVVDDNGYVADPEIKVIDWNDVLMSVWLAGTAVFGTIFAVSNLRFHKKLKNTRMRINGTKAWLPVYESSAVKTPCLFGAIKPAIYVTKDVLADGKVFSHVLEHETTHYRHGDHIWSVLRCFCLALHWYNPLVWLAAFLSMRDSELACDEDTIKRIGEEERIDYGRTLINLTCEKPAVGILSAATTMTGSKSSIKERILLIAKKPKMLKITAAVVAAIAVFAIIFTFTSAENYNPKTTDEPVLETYSNVLFAEISDINKAVRMKVTEASEKEITTEVFNGTSESVIYSVGYKLHFEQDGKWYELPVLDEETSDMRMAGTTLKVTPEMETSPFTNDIKKSYGKLPDGKYRILRTFEYRGFSENSEAESFVLAAEFVLEDGKLAAEYPAKLEEGEYVPVEQIFMNFSSSFFGIPGEKYQIKQRAFVTFDSETGEEIKLIPVSEWKWQEFPYSEEEWKNLFIATETIPFPDISAYRNRYYQPLEDGKFIASLDGELWLVDIDPKKMSTPDDLWVWDIYRIAPAEEETITDDMIGKDHSDELSIRETIDGTRISVRGNSHGLSPSTVIAEIPNEIYYIYSKNGTPAIDHPVDSYFEYCYDDLISQSPEQWKHYCVIECTYNYDWYRYEKNKDGVYELAVKEEQSKVPFGKYMKTSYYWSCRQMGMGLEDKDGNVLLDPIYSRINNQFGDRIIASDGVKQGFETARDYLFDENLNLLTSEFNNISYYFFEDYSYVGVAHCFGEHAEVICYDENGLVCESGVWFVDKNGKKISEKFESITMNLNRVEYDGGNYARMEPDGTAVVITENGEEKTIDVKKEYAIYSEDTYANGYDPFLEDWVRSLYVTKNYKTEKTFPAAVGAVFRGITNSEYVKVKEVKSVEVSGSESEFFAAYTYIDTEGAEQVLQVRMRKTEEGYGLLARGGGPIDYGLSKTTLGLGDIDIEGSPYLNPVSGGLSVSVGTNGKIGLLKADGTVAADFVYDSYDYCGNVIVLGKENSKTRKVVTEEYARVTGTEEKTCTEYRFYHYKTGEPITDKYGEDYYYTEIDKHPFSEWNDAFRFCENGNFYEYHYHDNGDVTLTELRKGGPTGKTLNGLPMIQYYYGPSEESVRIGISDKNGREIVPPVYNRIEAPFGDRFLANYHDMMVTNTTRIYDLSGKIVCDKYDTIEFSLFGGGSYVGIAECGGAESQSGTICFDENGNEMPKGFWFIDKNGNAVSERMDYYEWSGKILSEDDKITVSYFDNDNGGKEKEIPVKPYCLKNYETDLSKLKKAEKGDTVNFGYYHGETEWTVLEKDGDKLLLISNRSLDMKQFNEGYDQNVTWKNSTLRKWLNEEFIFEAFSKPEQDILVETVTARNGVKDKVSLLNYSETEKYFPGKNSRKVLPSEYAAQQAFYVPWHEDGNTWWWLREGKAELSIERVTPDGDVIGCMMTGSGFIRPIVWIDTSKI